MSKLKQVSKQILEHLLRDFQTRELSSDALHASYVGPAINDLKKKCLETDNTATNVDFDLAMKQLEKEDLVATGPVVPFDNDPNSSLIFMVLYSKHEYAYPTEKGYQAIR